MAARCLLFSLCAFSLCYFTQGNEFCLSPEKENIKCSGEVCGDAQWKRQLLRVRNYSANSAECAGLQLRSGARAYLGDVALRPYSWLYTQGSNNYTLLNVSFTNIHWSHIKMRFMADGNTTKNKCHEIFITGNISTVGNAINFDCYWSSQHENYEQAQFTFEYEAEGPAGRAYGRYVYIVPATNTLYPWSTEYIPFTYLNLSEVSVVEVHVVPPPWLRGSATYRLAYCTNNNSSCQQEDITVSSGLQEARHHLTNFFSGQHSYSLLQTSPSCGPAACTPVTGARIYYEPDGVIVYTVLWGLLAGCLLVAVYLTCLIIFEIRKSRTTPKVLLIHPQAESSSLEKIRNLVKVLQRDIGWDMMYETDTQRTAHNDPVLWCSRAFTEADRVVYVLPPGGCSEPPRDGQPVSIYKDMDKLLFKLLHAHRQDKHHNYKKVAVLTFSHSAVLPEQLRNYSTTFNIHRDWLKFLQFVGGGSSCDTFIRMFPHLSYASKHKAPPLQISTVEENNLLKK